MTDYHEQRVDEMIAEGLRITREAVERYKPVAIVAAYSSGDDSIVSTHFGMENFDDCFVFNANTLVGLKPSRDHLRAVCATFGWQLEVGSAVAVGPPKYMLEFNPATGRKKRVPFDAKVRCPAGHWVDGETVYEEKVLNFGFPGRGKPQHAIMYQTLKDDPIRENLLKLFGASGAKDSPRVMILSGIRRDESVIRAGYRRAYAEGNFGDVWVNPFYYRTAADFEAYRQEFGLPRNPVKRQCGISGECCCGTFGDGAERQAYREVDPAFADYLDGLEARVRANGFPWGWGESPPAWWVAKRRDEKSGQLPLFDDTFEVSTFQPMCVGCVSGRR